MTKMFIRYILSFVFPLTLILPAHGQDYLSKYPDPVLPDSVPQIFAPGLISKKMSHEEGIAFSPGGEEIFFTRSVADEEGEENSAILFLEKKGEKWTSPQSPSFASEFNESEPAFSHDGSAIFYFSERRKPGITPYIGEIWKVTRQNGRWSKPRYHENILNTSWINSVSTTSDGTLYFSSYRNKKMGIYYSLVQKGKYQEPVYLPKEINSVPGATHPFISSDGKTLVFEGQALGYGNSELYISFKTSKGHWTPAQKLNETINKTLTETNPSLSPDGKYLFFTRNSDIYWVRIEYVF